MSPLVEIDADRVRAAPAKGCRRAAHALARERSQSRDVRACATDRAGPASTSWICTPSCMPLPFARSASRSPILDRIFAAADRGGTAGPPRQQAGELSSSIWASVFAAIIPITAARLRSVKSQPTSAAGMGSCQRRFQDDRNPGTARRELSGAFRDGSATQPIRPGVSIITSAMASDWPRTKGRTLIPAGTIRWPKAISSPSSRACITTNCVSAFGWSRTTWSLSAASSC